MGSNIVDLTARRKDLTIEQEIRIGVLANGGNPHAKEDRLTAIKELTMQNKIKEAVNAIIAKDKETAKDGNPSQGWSMESIIEQLSVEFDRDLIRKVIITDVCSIPSEAEYIDSNIAIAREKKAMQSIFEEQSSV